MAVLRWGLIGAGDIARKRVAPALQDLFNCEFVSVSRSRHELAESFAREFGVRKWFGDWMEQIRDDEIDAVYIATPVYLHAEQTIAAANAGKHVLCEKPMALTTNECDEMIAACKANDVRLGIAYYRRYYPLIIRVGEIIQAGEIGQVTVAQMNAFEYFDPPPDHPRRWLLDRRKSGGGPLMDFGCHRIEILSHLFGDIAQSEAIVSNEIFSREVEDTAAVLLRFGNGTSASVTVTHAAIEPRDTLDLYGTKGSIHIQVLNGDEMVIRSDGSSRVEKHQPPANVHQPLIDDFTSSVLVDRGPQVNGEIGREISRLIEDIYQRKG